MIHVTSSKRISIWQTFRTAAWLEWQAQGNWTKPRLFLLYILARPLTAALVLVFMYWVISGFRTQGSFFGFLIVGSAAWSFVEQIMVRLSNAILDDREQFAMLKSVCQFSVLRQTSTIPPLLTPDTQANVPA